MIVSRVRLGSMMSSKKSHFRFVTEDQTLKVWELGSGRAVAALAGTRTRCVRAQ